MSEGSIPETIRQAVHAWNEENRDGGCVHFDKGFGLYRACDDPDNDVPIHALANIVARWIDHAIPAIRPRRDLYG